MEQEFKINYIRLLKYANTEAGRYLLGIKDKRRIVKISPNSFHLLNGRDKNRFSIVARFYTSNRVAAILLPIITKLEIAKEHSIYARLIKENPYRAFLHYSGLEQKNSKYPQIYLTNFNTTSGDGRVIMSNEVTWAAARDSASGEGATAGPTTSEAPIADNIGGGYYVYRAFFPSDTSSLTALAIISAVVFNGNITSFGNGSTTITLQMVQTSQASPSTLVNDDFNNLVFTGGGSVTRTTTGAYQITLDATGRSWINLTGNTLIGQIEDHDLTNTAPALDVNYDVVQNFAAGTNPPYYDITYTLAAGGDENAYFL